MSAPVLPKTAASEIVRSVQTDGYAIVPGLLSQMHVERLRDALEHHRGDAGEGRRSGSDYAMRNLLQLVPEVRALAWSPAIEALVTPLLGRRVSPIRGILFDKTRTANWAVGWHQDLIIPVRERKEAPGFTGWSVKAGVAHCHPPVRVLERMLTVRVHLDETGEENGPLRVLPGSHLSGKLDPEAVRQWRERCVAVPCLVPAGGALLMRPLLLHASSPARSPGHRRVIHLEFAADPLPGGLEWPDFVAAPGRAGEGRQAARAESSRSTLPEA